MIVNDEFACIYAALILHDDDIAITDEKIKTILKAANVTVEPYWPSLFAKALDGVPLNAMITNVGAAVGAAGGSAGEASSDSAAAKEEKKEEKKEESEDSDGDDMGFGLFD